MSERADRPNDDGEVVEVSLRRARVREDTPDELLWEVIKDRTQALGFAKYARFYESDPPASRLDGAHRGTSMCTARERVLPDRAPARRDP